MVEYVEELDVKPELQLLSYGKQFGKVEVTPGEIWAAQRVATASFCCGSKPSASTLTEYAPASVAES
jgi:hypothetical protein